MARYRLLAQHFSEEDKLLEEGTIVGDGTEHAWSRPPTTEMEAMDDEGRQLLEKERRRVGETRDPTDDLAMTMGETDSTPPRRHKKRPAEPEPEPDPPA